MLISLTQSGEKEIKGESSSWFISLCVIRKETEPHSNKEIPRLSLVLGIHVTLAHWAQPEWDRES